MRSISTISSFTLTLTFFLCLTHSALAQEDYNSILTDGNKWLERLTHHVSPGALATYDYQLHLTDIDTVIEDQSYKVIQVLSRSIYTGISEDLPLLDNLVSDTTAQFWAGIRQEDRRVYLYIENEDHLAYDFNLIAGDSLPTSFFFPGGLITNVDTVVIRDIDRKRFHITNNYGDSIINYFIYEGIGSSFGLYPSAPFPTNVELICQSNTLTDQVTYLSDNYDQCYNMIESTDDVAAHFHSFVNEDNRWTYTHIRQVSNNKLDTITFEGIFDGKVVVEDREYHEAFERIALHESHDWESLGYYRQEDAKVYRWDDFANEDLLLYNFDMDSIGSTFSYSYGLNFTLELINIDSVSLKNGELRKRQTFKVLDHPGVGETYWIEGIGSEDTPLFPSSLLDENVDGGNFKLECFFTNEEHLLQQNPSGQCAYLIVDVEDLNGSSKQLQLYPNPITKGDPLFLSGDLQNLSAELDISIYSTIGERIHQSTIRSNDPILIDYTIDSGLYYCIITSGKTTYQTTFIVID